MTYRISHNDYETWDSSKDGNLMYNIFNICKVCKGKLGDESYKARFGSDKQPINVPEPICINCLRDDKIEKLWT
jgi:hypothetical protein